MSSSGRRSSKGTRISLLKNRSASRRRAAEALSRNAARFRSLVWKYWEKSGRHDLPWRRTRDPYKILVSEVMLQQTQVERVRPFYENFLKQFPSVAALARAPLGDVLKAWQGLGYNRRAKMLHQAAKEIVEKYGDKLPRSAEELEKLPGIGHYTANAVAAFAFNQDAVFIETNIRTAILYSFFSTRTSVSPPTRGARAARPIPPLAGGLPSVRVSDREVLEILERLLPRGKSREWNYALMDYGAYLKRNKVNLSARSKHYTKQSKFAGSLRQARGAILKELVKGLKTRERLLGLLGDDRRPQLAAALAALRTEGLIEKRGRAFALPR
jgi:A/G-specific adenine glycosylase